VNAEVVRYSQLRKQTAPNLSSSATSSARPPPPCTAATAVRLCLPVYHIRYLAVRATRWHQRCGDDSADRRFTQVRSRNVWLIVLSLGQPLPVHLHSYRGSSTCTTSLHLALRKSCDNFLIVGCAFGAQRLDYPKNKILLSQSFAFSKFVRNAVRVVVWREAMVCLELRNSLDKGRKLASPVSVLSFYSQRLASPVVKTFFPVSSAIAFQVRPHLRLCRFLRIVVELVLLSPPQHHVNTISLSWQRSVRNLSTMYIACKVYPRKYGAALCFWTPEMLLRKMHAKYRQRVIACIVSHEDEPQCVANQTRVLWLAARGGTTLLMHEAASGNYKLERKHKLGERCSRTWPGPTRGELQEVRCTRARESESI